MLHRHGFATLMVDLRDHGDSTIEDGRFAGGTDEYRDVLGAWDWLQADRGIVADRIGLVGISMGAATVMIATGEEPGVAATWEDSSYADIGVAISDELARNGYPTFLAPGGTLLARFASGDDLTTLSPLGAVAKLNGRPLFITHGDADQRLSVRYAHDLASALRTSGGNYELWIVPGSTHANAMVTNTQEYEQRLSDFFGRHLR
jgi:dipeptidyl aminopeptidase/acylaminoacyl peptidase